METPRIRSSGLINELLASTLGKKWSFLTHGLGRIEKVRLLPSLFGKTLNPHLYLFLAYTFPAVLFLYIPHIDT